MASPMKTRRGSTAKETDSKEDILPKSPDEWSIKENLALLAAILKTGESSWGYVSRIARQSREKHHPVEFFSVKNCAAQYSKLLDSVEGQKKRRGGDDAKQEPSPTELLFNKYSQARRDEIARELATIKEKYFSFRQIMKNLKSDLYTDEEMAKIQEEFLSFPFEYDDETTLQEMANTENDFKEDYEIDEVKNEKILDFDFDRLFPSKSKEGVVKDENLSGINPELDEMLKDIATHPEFSSLASSLDLESERPLSSSLLSGMSKGAPCVSPQLTKLVKSAIAGTEKEDRFVNLSSAANAPTLSALLEMPLRGPGQPLPEIPMAKKFNRPASPLNVSSIVKQENESTPIKQFQASHLKAALQSTEKKEFVRTLRSSNPDAISPGPKSSMKPIDSRKSSASQDEDVEMKSISSSKTDLPVEIKVEEEEAESGLDTTLEDTPDVSETDSPEKKSPTRILSPRKDPEPEKSVPETRETRLKQREAALLAEQKKREEEEKPVMRKPSSSDNSDHSSRSSREKPTSTYSKKDQGKEKESPSILTTRRVTRNAAPSPATVQQLSTGTKKNIPAIPGKSNTPQSSVSSSPSVSESELNTPLLRSRASVSASEKLKEKIPAPKEKDSGSGVEKVKPTKVKLPENEKKEEVVTDYSEHSSESELDMSDSDVKKTTKSGRTRLESTEMADEDSSNSDSENKKRITRRQSKLSPRKRDEKQKDKDEGRDEKKKLRDSTKPKRVSESSKDTDLQSKVKEEKDEDSTEEKRTTRARAKHGSPSKVSKEAEPSVELETPRTTRSRAATSISTPFSLENLPLLPLDSAPSSPSSSTTTSTNFEEDKEQRAFRKSIMMILNRICAHKHASLFLKPISEEAVPGYSKRIKRPMDLTTIKRNIETGIIRTVKAFERDILLMFLNALMFNASNTNLSDLTREMHKDTVEMIEEYKSTQKLVRTDGSEAGGEKDRERLLSLRRDISGRNYVTPSDATHSPQESETEQDEEKKITRRMRPSTTIVRQAQSANESGGEGTGRDSAKKGRPRVSTLRRNKRGVSPDIVGFSPGLKGDN